MVLVTPVVDPVEVPSSEEHNALVKRVETLESDPTPTPGVSPEDHNALVERVETLESTPEPGPTTGNTYVGMPYTVITEPTDAGVQAGLKAWRSKFRGNFPLTKLAFAFSGTADLRTPLDTALGTGQIQGARWEGLAKRSTVLRWSNPDTPLYSSYGALRNWVWEDFTLQGANNAKGLYLNSTASKSNQDGLFRQIETLGSWDYFIGLDGDATSNLNSEIGFERCAMGNDAAFRTAYFWSGMSPEHNQQDQFLNYWFRDCKFEGASGDYLRFDKGGHIDISGGSWIYVNGAGRMIYMPDQSHHDGVQHLNVQGLRFEIRGADQKVIDCAWRAGSYVDFRECSDVANSFKAFAPAAVPHTYRGGANARYEGCTLLGSHEHLGTSGSIEYERTRFRNKNTRADAVSTPNGARTSFRRVMAGNGSTIPDYAN